ncbi:nitrous oxide reductase family maturation protein NosD [Pontibacter sp. SGAir0037]|uniref:nitrous oxide reductase family maturation protein NosD n=1 Tax=Pontibacter sp. SGAir0037 TaxID=2571030 RepID=UPI0010CD1897|nr:nitrous oxide reductase family maturation protein NosD [Pontibacter sp. SGAir0037]QCR22482.1 nitrous oxide reductase family maturation protein NosD [Pontibacter sp. SGAir0037]
MKDLSKYFSLVAATLVLLLWADVACGNTLRVCTSCHYTSLKQAIAKAKPGDTVLIEGGIYQEHGIEINKPLTILGRNKPVIDGNYKGQIFTISSDNVTVEGLTLKNITTSYTRDDAAIRVVERGNIRILNNSILNTYFGIYLQNADNCVIKGNVVTGRDVAGMNESALGNAIHLWYCNNAVISNNKVRGHRDGIYLEFVKDSEVKDNLSQHNLRYGLHFMFSDRNVYTHNIFRQNGAGVAVMYTRDIRMEHNTFEGNWGAASYGLLLKEISNSVIQNNTFRSNTTGIYMEGSNRLNIHRNDFDQNGWAIRLLSSCSDDVFRLNNFTGNSFDVSTNGNSTLNRFENNYWDKYGGYDLNKDELGDVPYRPVSLYAMLVERVPPSVMFMRSFMVDLLDSIEKVLPSFIPEDLVDDQPLMRKISHDNNRKLTKVIR